jgi:aspartyl-tRNA(Asn)/glutamyl-tRNA(Gln) amidotransferase subunit A
MPSSHTLNAWEAAEAIAAGTLTSEALVRDCLQRIEERDPAIAAWTHLDPQQALAQARERDGAPKRSPLHGVPVGIKDIIDTADMPTTYGSPIYAAHQTAWDAACVALLRQAGAVVMGKTVSTEFAMYEPGKTANPHNPAHTPGGSSSGSAAAVAAGMVPFALGSDTGGSVRQPASFCGVYGLKPTYGAVSRFGLVAYASSLDVIGIAAGDVATTRAVFETIRGVDALDQSSVDYPEPPPPGAVDALVVGIPEGVLEGVDPAVRAGVHATRERLEGLGIRCVPVGLGSLEHVVPAYYVIATAEASANLARYDGVRYGARGAADAADAEELTVAARSAGFGAEVKLRILVGTYVLRSGFQEQYYQRAQRVRTLIRRAFDRAFQEVDLLLLPTFPVPPFAIGDAGLDAFHQKQGDLFTCTANLTGLPALAVPSTVDGGRPIGVQLMAPHFREDLLFQVAAPLAAQYAAPRPPGCLDPATLAEAVG